MDLLAEEFPAVFGYWPRLDGDSVVVQLPLLDPHSLASSLHFLKDPILFIFCKLIEPLLSIFVQALASLDPALAPLIIPSLFGLFFKLLLLLPNLLEMPLHLRIVLDMFSITKIKQKQIISSVLLE